MAATITAGAMFVASGFDHLAGRTPQGLPDAAPIIKEST
jgi:hypothetical protein